MGLSVTGHQRRAVTSLYSCSNLTLTAEAVNINQEMCLRDIEHLGAGLGACNIHIESNYTSLRVVSIGKFTITNIRYHQCVVIDFGDTTHMLPIQ